MTVLPLYHLLALEYTFTKYIYKLIISISWA